MKKYIIDTNVILANPLFTRDFEKCEIIIPVHVLEELDKIKGFEGSVGFRARKFFRYFKEIENKGNLLNGIEIENQVILKTLILTNMEKLPESFDGNYTDNKVLSIMLSEKYKTYILITNDVSMRVKASSLGIECELIDASTKHKMQDLYDGILELEVDEEKVKEFYKNGEISPSDLGIEEIYPNQFIYGLTEYNYSKILGRYDGKKKRIVKLKFENATAYGVKAKDIRQIFALEALLNPEIPFVTMTAKQGCGKTLLALAAALEQVSAFPIYEKILIAKNTSPIDKWSYQGFTTGDTEEKLLTHFGNYTTTLENIQSLNGKGNKSGLEILENIKEQGKLDVLDISSILGSSFLNNFVIVDEAQSFDIHAMRSIVTRIGENCKLVLIGDLGQQTISRLDPDKSGLFAAVEWLKPLEETAHITLKNVHRSNFVEKASKIFDEKIFG